MLKAEIDLRKKEFKTDSYSISIGEIKSMYENGEIEINPDFQRLFRWSNLQKTKLIESILLGIPIPSVFVYQREDGVWEVVDGLQRLSSILQFFGVLKKSSGTLYPPLKLTKTKYLSSLENVVWNKKNKDEIELEIPLQLYFKRAKLNFSIILNESDPTAKYEVFQRLNTGGTFASNQEIRNVIMIMINRDVYNWFMMHSKNEDFLSTISLSERLEEEQYHIELVLRFIGLRYYEYNPKKDVKEFLDDTLDSILIDKSFNFEKVKINFEKVFRILNEILQDKAFKKYNGEKDQFQGKFLESAFEAITVGLSYNIDDIDNNIIIGKIKEMWKKEEFINNSGSGTNASMRIPKIIPFAKKHFKRN
ncbi:MAG: DUF262 domain-containing protein [Bacteroidales bacterium]|nr:DUF262 domain-containing protein [Bacteroidales bacterium]